MLLCDLYMRALKILEQGDREAVDPARRLAAVKEEVRETLIAATAAEPDVRAFLDEMPDRYFFTLPEGDVPLHFELMRALGERPLVAPPSPFSRTRIQRIHRGDARSAGLVLDDRGRADGQQSQYPFRAHHHPQHWYRAGCVPRLASWADGRDGAGRRSMAAASSATSNTSSPASSRDRGAGRLGASRSERGQEVPAPRRD